MTRVLVANFFTADSFRAELDDPEKPYEVGMVGYASPQLYACTIADRPPDWWVALLKAAVLDEAAYMLEQEDEELPLGDRPVTWETEGWVEQPPDHERGARPNQIFSCMRDGEEIAMLVIQAVTADGRK